MILSYRSKTIFTSIILCTLGAAAGVGGQRFRFLFVGLIYFIATIYFLSKSATRNSWLEVLGYMLIPPSLVYLPIIIKNSAQTMVSMPATIVHFIAILAALISHCIRNERFKTIYIGSFVLLICSVYFGGYKMWLNHLSYGSYTGSVNFPFPKLTGTTQNNREITNESFRKKTVLIDFWHTGCGVCFKKFPTLQKFYNEHRNDHSLLIYALNKPLPRDTPLQAFNMLSKTYNFPVIIPHDSQFPESVGIEVYPTTIVIDTNNNVIFRGSLEKAMKVVRKQDVK